MKASRDVRVVAVGGLGDSLILTAFLETLAERSGSGHVKVVTTIERRPLFETNPHVDQIEVVSHATLPLYTVPDPRWDIFSPYMTGELVAERGRVNVNLRFPMKANLRSISVIDQIAEQAGLPAAVRRPRLHLTSDDHADAARCLREVGLAPGARFLVVAPSTGPGREKRWPTGHWNRALRRIGMVVPMVLLGDEVGDLLPDVIHLRRSSAIRTSAAILMQSCGFLSVDTFLPHLAASVGVTGAVLFGPSNVAAFGYPENLNLFSDVDCSPCGDTVRRQDCRDNICMQRLAPDRVVDRLLAWLSER